MPPRRCPTCRRLVTARRCPRCVRQRDASRPNANARGYCSERWRRLRAAVLALHPWCSVCLAAGKSVPATDVDHVVPHHGPDHHLFWDFSNLDAKCHACHSRKTATQDSGFAKKGAQR